MKYLTIPANTTNLNLTNIHSPKHHADMGCHVGIYVKESGPHGTTKILTK